MNNPNYDSYMATIHQPAIEGIAGDMHIFMDNIALNVQPDLIAKSEPDYVALAKQYKRGVAFKQLFKKK